MTAEEILKAIKELSHQDKRNLYYKLNENENSFYNKH